MNYGTGLSVPAIDSNTLTVHNAHINTVIDAKKRTSGTGIVINNKEISVDPNYAADGSLQYCMQVL